MGATDSLTANCQNQRGNQKIVFPCEPLLFIINDRITIRTEAVFMELGISPASLSQDLKDIIKQKIKERMNLTDKDVVLFLNDKVVVRRFRTSNEVSENFKRKQRYNGLAVTVYLLAKKDR